MAESINSLAALKRHIESLDRGPAQTSYIRMPTGHLALDEALGGGLARGRLHELFGDLDEEGATAGAALLFGRLTAGSSPLLWLRTQGAARASGTPYGPGLAALGLDPACMLIGIMADDAMLLRAAVEALRCPALGAVLIELRGRASLLDLTASRRLSLAAEASGVTPLLLRIGGDPVPSAAETRWRVMAAPSDPLPGNAPGMTAFALHLLRRRAGPDGKEWRLIWDSQKGAFGDGRNERHDDRATAGGHGGGASLSGDVVPIPAAGSAADRAA